MLVKVEINGWAPEILRRQNLQHSCWIEMERRNEEQWLRGLPGFQLVQVVSFAKTGHLEKTEWWGKV